MKKYFMLLFVAFLCGCAGFREGSVSSVKAFPVSDKKVSLSISLDFIIDMNGNKITSEASKNKIKTMVLNRFNRSGLFSNVALDASGQDYVLKIKYEDIGNGNRMTAALTGATLYIIPSYAKDTNIISARLVNNRTGEIENIETFHESLTLWQGIYFLPLMPFKYWPTQANNMANDLIDNLILQTYEKIQHSSH